MHVNIQQLLLFDNKFNIKREWNVLGALISKFCREVISMEYFNIIWKYLQREHTGLD